MDECKPLPHSQVETVGVIQELGQAVELGNELLDVVAQVDFESKS